MTRQINVLDCQPDVLLLALPHIENKLAQEPLQEFYGRQKIPMDTAATLSEHHAPVTNDGYVMHDHFIFENSFGARILASTKDEIPTPHIVRYDDHSSEQYVALIIVLIILLNQHGDAFKPQADAKEGNTHQAALFASSTQGLSVLRKYEQQDWQALFTSPTQLQALLAATLHTTQRDIPRRREQKDQHVEYEQQDWQAAPESDKRFRFHRKQDAQDITQLVDGDDTVFIRLVDYDLVDGQLAYAAGGPPSKPLEWMVSNPLSPNPSTVAMQAQDGFGRYGNLIVTGLITPEDNEASEKKAEQLALDSSSGLAHLSRMGAYNYTLPSVFEPPSDSKSGQEGDPAVPIPVNTPSVEPRGTSRKSTSDLCRGCTSPFVAGVAGKPRIQRLREFADTATKGKAKDKEPRPAPSYLPVRQELPSDSDSEAASATIASVRKHPPPRTN